MKKRIIIIGAGIAGLSAGCYAQMNGFDAEIFEMHSIPGGLCTSWVRKGYVFDGCIHFLIGTNPESRLRNLWNEVGALDGKEIVNHDVYMQIEGDSGQKLTLYSDIDRLEKHMLEISPADAKQIKEFTNAIRDFSISGDWQEAAAGGRLRQISMNEFTSELHDPFLREALSNFGSMNFFLMSMNSYSRNDAGWPVGGSLGVAENIEKRFLDLGGHVRYQSKVEEILVKDGRAAGVRLADGTICNADYIISAADGYATIFNLLQGKYINGEINALYSNAKTVPTSVQISLGVDCDLSEEPHDLLLKLDKTVDLAGAERRSILIKNYCYDKTLCPKGKSVVISIFSSDFEYWETLSQDRKSYMDEKEKIAAAFIKIFEDRFQKAKGKVEVFDVATPVTYNRYTGAWKGAYMSWMSSPQWPVTSVPSSLPGLDAFYMTGQWTHPGGGLPVALTTARGTIMKICESDGRGFVTLS